MIFCYAGSGRRKHSSEVGGGCGLKLAVCLTRIFDEMTEEEGCNCGM